MASSGPDAPRAARAVAAAFAAAVGGLKLGQHFSFQTQAYDLGAFTSVVWNTLHGRFFLNSLNGDCYLGDHFSPLLALLGPFLLLWKNAAVLLLLQTLALAAAIPAVYRMGERWVDRRAGLAFAVLFAAFPYVHHVSRYDFHDVVFAVPLYLHALDRWERGRFRSFLGFLAAATLLREDMALVTAGVGAHVALFSERRGEARWRRGGALIAAGALALFALEALVLMPSLGRWQAGIHSYAHLGADVPSILRSLADPAVLWRNTAGDPARLKAAASLAGWTGGLALLSPGRLAMLAIPLGYNMVSGVPDQSAFRLHYSAALLPFLFFAAARGAGAVALRFPAARGRLWAVPAALALAALPALPSYFVPIGWERMRAGREIIAQVPAGESVQTTNNLFPHVGLRERAGLFPLPRPTRWVLLDREMTGFHPPEEYKRTLEDFSRRYAGRRVAASEGFELYRFAEAP